MSILKKLVLSLIPVVLFSFFPVLLCAQYDSGKQDNMGKEDHMGMAKLSATGCLKQGDSKNGYYLKGEDGKTYELWGYKNMGEHLNHKVTVTGMEQKMPESEEKMKMHEKEEAGGGPQMDMKVQHLKHISDKCE